MGEVLNLNKARKAKARADKTGTATANRIAHGRTKLERAKDTAEAARHAATLDGAKRDA